MLSYHGYGHQTPTRLNLVLIAISIWIWMLILLARCTSPDQNSCVKRRQIGVVIDGSPSHASKHAVLEHDD
ncbi:MAG: hypothetical protein CM15mP95_2780 [Alphaproteobacteria bacterium]|nr:MAG: hypothetical protein CM15mP95_2780 [Alphaproteobacteria bacterium]